MAIAWFTDAHSADGLPIVNGKTSATTTTRETSTKHIAAAMTCHKKKETKLSFV